MARVLVTGAAGYIGSHVTLLLLKQGHTVIALDNLCNSHRQSLHRAVSEAKIAKHAFRFYQMDIKNIADMRRLFHTHKLDAVLHFAGLKSLPDSLLHPLSYYEINVSGTLNLLRVCKDTGVRTIIFSSSAAVYGNPISVPISETMPTCPHNPYAQSKLIIEQCLNNLLRSDTSWRIANLRYFNPVGAHPSGLLGESPLVPPTNLMPLIARAAVNPSHTLLIYGKDWPTPDGTCIRDYIHVMDLAEGHVSALHYLLEKKDSFTVNLGTGRGHSVLELLHTFQHVCGQKISYTFSERREGDVASCYADVTLAKTLLGWEAKHSLTTMCEDTWRWYQHNPQGYQCLAKSPIAAVY